MYIYIYIYIYMYIVRGVKIIKRKILRQKNIGKIC